jgi:hypothetical protein
MISYTSALWASSVDVRLLAGAVTALLCLSHFRELQTYTLLQQLPPPPPKQPAGGASNPFEGGMKSDGHPAPLPGSFVIDKTNSIFD